MSCMTPEQAEIVNEVAAASEWAVADIIGPRRFAPLVRVRDEAIWRLRTELNLSLPAIGHIVNRHHASVLESLRRTFRRTEVEAFALRRGDRFLTAEQVAVEAGLIDPPEDGTL